MKAIIVGHNGQDGQLLQSRLKAENYQIFPISPSTGYFCLNDLGSVCHTVEKFNPDSIFYLPAYHSSSENTADDYKKSNDTHALGVYNFLEAMRLHTPRAHLFYASSCRIFGEAIGMQDETTPYNPNCIYGITKTAGTQLCQFYRKNHGVKASVGILYNHESHLRKDNFLFKKVVKSVVQIKRGELTSLTLGNLDTRVDWGYAPDYVDAMLKITAPQRDADDYIIATGELHSVGDLVEIAFRCVGLNWAGYVKLDATLAKRRNTISGDNSRIRSIGWQPSVSFEKMVEIMVRHEEECR